MRREQLLAASLPEAGFNEVTCLSPMGIFLHRGQLPCVGHGCPVNACSFKDTENDPPTVGGHRRALLVWPWCCCSRRILGQCRTSHGQRGPMSEWISLGKSLGLDSNGPTQPQSNPIQLPPKAPPLTHYLNEDFIFLALLTQACGTKPLTSGPSTEVN